MKKKDIFIKGVRKFFVSFTGLVYIIIVISLWISVYSSYLKLKKSTDVIKKEQEKVEALKTEGKNLDEELTKVQSGDYIEQQLRDKLQLAKEGEIVIILPDPEVVKKFAPQIEKEEEVILDPNWKKWIKLFL